MAAALQQAAKRAPKLAYVISKTETKPINPRDINDTFTLPRLSDSKWWIQLQNDYIYQRGLTGDQVNPLLDSRNLHRFVESRDDGCVSNANSLSKKEAYEFVKMDSDDLGSFVSKKSRILEPWKVKCGQTDISRGGSQHDTSKGKLLEALCHSQTSAREAEVAVKKACEEKEHVVKVLLRQAAQLFAYRQLIYVLQIENLCYQMKNNESDLIPLVGSKFGKLDKNMKTVGPKKGERIRTERGFGRYGHDLGKYGVVFVVGLGIVGAGLVFGWTIGWMLI